MIASLNKLQINKIRRKDRECYASYISCTVFIATEKVHEISP
jgi:hypothetical protein